MAASFTWWRAKSPTNHPAKSHCSGAQNTGLQLVSVQCAPQVTSLMLSVAAN